MYMITKRKTPSTKNLPQSFHCKRFHSLFLHLLGYHSGDADFSITKKGCYIQQMNIMNLLSSNDFNIKFWYKIQFILNIVWVELCHKFKFQSRNIRQFFHSTWDESIQLIHHLYTVKKITPIFDWIYRNLDINCPCFPFQKS